MQESICWKCKNAYAKKCRWVANGEKVWEEAKKKKAYHSSKESYELFIVTKCKNFLPEERTDSSDGIRGYLTPYDEKIRLKLYQQGLTDREIAEQLGISTSTIGYWRRSRGHKPNIKERRCKAK